MKTKTENPNLPTLKVEEFTSILQTAPNILETNQKSVANCNRAGQGLLDAIEANGEINSDELDAKAAEFVSKAKITVKRMNERRSPLTQLLTRISKEFTSLEAEINHTNNASVTAKVQAYRNQYAEKKLAEIRAKEEELKRQRERENEKNEYRSDLTLSLEKHFSDYLTEKSENLHLLFSETTLKNFDAKAKAINEFSTVYPAREHFSKFKDSFMSVYLTTDDKSAIKKDIIPSIMNSCINRYANSIQDLKDELILKLPSRRRELEEIEELHKKDAEAAKRAIENAKKREAEQAKARELELKKQQEKERLEAQAKAAEAELLSSFNNTAEMVTTNIPDAKVTKKIKVNNVKGFLEIYQMWFLAEGMDMSIEQLEKIHKRMITACEKRANKYDEFLNSAFIEYIDDVKAK